MGDIWILPYKGEDYEIKEIKRENDILGDPCIHYSIKTDKHNAEFIITNEMEEFLNKKNMKLKVFEFIALNNEFNKPEVISMKLSIIRSEAVVEGDIEYKPHEYMMFSITDINGELFLF